MDREEAIRRIKAWNLDSGDREVLAVVIPELAESEDEKTRKELLEEIESIIPHEDETDSEGLILPSYHTRIDRYKSYLEKQKEYELTEEDKKIIPEALVMLCDDIINHRVHTPIKTDEEGARKIKAFLKTFNRQPHKTMKEWEKQKEQKPAEWDKLQEDFRNINEAFEDGKKEVVAHPEKYDLCKPAEWSDTDNIGWDEAFACVTQAEKSAKNEEELQNAVTAEKWLKEIKFKYYVHPVKQEWSEEDEKKRQRIIKVIEAADSDWVLQKAYGPYGDLINWLKSLRPSWKPSEEQMSMLLAVIRDPNNAGSESCSLALKSIYEQLKKLM